MISASRFMYAVPALVLLFAASVVGESLTLAFRTPSSLSERTLGRIERIARGWGWVPVLSETFERHNLLVFHLSGAVPSPRLTRRLERLAYLYPALRRAEVRTSPGSIRIATGEFMVFLEAGTARERIESALRNAGYRITFRAGDGDNARLTVLPAAQAAVAASERLREIGGVPGVKAVEETSIYIKQDPARD